MKKIIYLLISILLFSISCKKEKIPVINITINDSSYILHKDSTITFSINAETERFLTKFEIYFILDSKIIVLFDTLLNTDNFIMQYNYTIPDSLTSKCESSPIEFFFDFYQDDNKIFTKIIPFRIDYDNTFFTKQFTLYAITNDINKKGYLSIDNNTTYTPEEAINHAADVDFALYFDYIYYDLYFTSPSYDDLRENNDYGTKNWDTVKNNSLNFSHVYGFTEEEFASNYNSMNIEKIANLNTFNPYYNALEINNVLFVSKYFVFFTDKYFGIMKIIILDNSNEKKLELELKYIYKCWQNL
ncbi:MAG: hypothetical protein JXL97_07090 [Bacteroidales bacterium]|nr:hypothetical protein [Bacteroidales bacterium]